MTPSFFPSSDNDGQYMVEFGLTIVIFILFVIFVIDIGLMIFNHNLFYRGLSKASQVAATGGSNREIDREINQKLVESYFPGILSSATVDTYSITPKKEIKRVNGTTVTIEMQATFGLYILGMFPLTLEVPIESRALIFQANDRDRDGCKDTLEGSGVSCDSYQSFSSTAAQDHDNDGSGDEYHFEGGVDSDADSDGVTWYGDTVAIAYFSGSNCSEGYWIARPNNSAHPSATTCTAKDHTWEKEWFDGWYHAPERWSDDSEARWRLFPRELPNLHVTNDSDDYDTRVLRTEHDRDNDGWVDRFDIEPDTVTEQYEGDYR